MREIAVYGKGGIGKSTLSANLSAALALSGRRVLQIGCDPKHDSTRLLTRGRAIPTVLDYLRVTGPGECKIEDILFHGFAGIGCVEAGGPKPGVGCAGRGIITAFELLEQFQIKKKYDIILYDVLGDVVCGGFAVPIRREYADTIFIVTSGEYMALYAANNILRGIRNYDGTECRVAGILYNSRNVEGEDRRVEAFARAVGLPVCARIPRSDAFAAAEGENRTVVQLSGELGKRDSESASVAEIFLALARRIDGGLSLYEAKPLSDQELESAIFSTPGGAAGETAAVARAVGGIGENAPVPPTTVVLSVPSVPSVSSAPVDLTSPNRYLSKNMVRDEPLHGCAFNGAVTMGVHIRDAVILAHSPKSCAYISWQTISSSGRRRLFERGALLPVSISPNFESTEMDEADMIFGGMEKLSEAIARVKKRKPKAIVVVSSCPAGIIGDDIDQVKQLSEPGTVVVTVKADGNLTGDYLQGMLQAYTGLARQIIRRGIPMIPKTVNVVFEKVIAKNTAGNFKTIKGFLDGMGVSVNCRFLCETTFDRLENFCSAPLNLLAYKDYTGNLLADFFSGEYGCRFFGRPFPVGFAETEQWLAELADFFECPAAAERLIRENRRSYGERIEKLKPALAGKRLMIITYNHNLDWILQTAMDVGMVIVKLCILNFSQDEGFTTNLQMSLPLEENYHREKREEDIANCRPDILLSNYESSVTCGTCVADTIPMCPDVGFFAGLLMAERWAKLLELNLQGEWKNDERLFREYYTR